MVDLPRRERFHPRSILHPTDFSVASEVAFTHALRLALLAHAELELLHVSSPSSSPAAPGDEFPAVRETLVRWGLLDPHATRDDVARLGVRVRKVGLAGADPVDVLLEHLAHDPAELIVLATQRREGLARWIERQVGRRLARLAQIPTLFVPQGADGFVSWASGEIRLGHVLLPVDHAPSPQLALDVASDLARLVGVNKVRFTAFHAGRRDRFPEVVPAHRPGYAWELVSEEGSAAEAILANAAGADLVVATTAGRHGFLDALRGSTTEQVVAGARCPVLAVPA